MTLSSIFLGTIGISFGIALFGGALRAEEPSLPSQPEGFYPTYIDTGYGLLLGTDDTYRSSGNPLQPPDLGRWAATGNIWPYEIETGPVSEMHRVTNWMDYIFRPLTPGETSVIQGPTSESWFQLGASFPFLSRTAHAEQTHFAAVFGDKATQYSPLYFDVLNISAIAAYDDISGPGAAGYDDGFVSALSVEFRGIFRITHNTSITTFGEVYFILFNDEADAGFYISAGAPGAFVNFNSQFEVGEWDVRIFDDLCPYSGREILMDKSYRGVVDTTGHHTIGLPTQLHAGSWWDTEGTILVNTAGLTAGRFIGDSLRLLTGFSRMDQWLWDDFGEHVPTEYLSAGLFYDGYDWWIAPSLTYTMTTSDFEDPQQQVTLYATAPITPNLSSNAGVGYSFGDFYEGLYWHLGFNYLQTERLTHTFTYSSGYQDTAFGKDYAGEHLAYGLSYRLGARSHLGLTLGLQNDDLSDATSFDAGISMNVALGNYTWLRLFTGYLDYDDRPNIANHNSTSDRVTWLYSATLGRQLLSRLHGEITAEFLQYDDDYPNNSDSYDEFFLMLRLTRTF